MMNLDKQNLTATPAINAKSEPAGASDGKRQAANVLLLILTCLTSVAFERHHYYWLPLLAIPLIFYGLKRPFDLLTLALVLAPLDIGFKNDRANNLPVIFSISDVLLLMALPGAALRLRRRPDVWSLGGMTLPMLGYLLAGLLSFAVNLPQMGSGGLGFFGGWIRNAQSVLGPPVALRFNGVALASNPQRPARASALRSADRSLGADQFLARYESGSVYPEHP